MSLSLSLRLNSRVLHRVRSRLLRTRSPTSPRCVCVIGRRAVYRNAWLMQGDRGVVTAMLALEASGTVVVGGTVGVNGTFPSVHAAQAVPRRRSGTCLPVLCTRPTAPRRAP